jgi:predicted MFS family arabinose efflux permease
MGGTIGWIVVSWPLIFLLSAKSTVEEMRWIFLVGAIISFVLAGFSLTLPHTPPRRAGEGGAETLAWLEAVKLLRLPYVFLLFVVTLIDSTIHNGYFVLIGGFLQDTIKMPNNWISAITTIGQVAEIVTMLILGSVLKRIGWKWTMAIGVLGHALPFAVFAFFDKPEYQGIIIAVQVLHGICYAFFFATLYIFVDAVFPKDIRTSAQGLFNLLVLGAGLVLANFWFGSLKAQWTAQPESSTTISCSWCPPVSPSWQCSSCSCFSNRLPPVRRKWVRRNPPIDWHTPSMKTTRRSFLQQSATESGKNGLTFAPEALRAIEVIVPDPFKGTNGWEV